jgi:hypothetical protein
MENLNSINNTQNLINSTQQDNPIITLQNLNKLYMGVVLAQSRGAYSFDESADLAESVRVISKFINFYGNNNINKDTTQTTQQVPTSSQNTTTNLIQDNLNLTDLE